MSGIFITLEGGDGAGKSTQAMLLEAWLGERGYEVVRTREPGGTRLGTALRDLLLRGGEVAPRAEALLYAADRAQHVDEVVRPALQRGAAVVQDRYVDSSLAYQGAGRPLDQAEIRSLSEWATQSLKPQLTVLLDIAPELGAKRRAAAGESADRLEREALDFHERVRRGFLGLAAAEPDRFIVVDASLDIDVIHTEIIARLAPLVNSSL